MSADLPKSLVARGPLHPEQSHSLTETDDALLLEPDSNPVAPLYPLCLADLAHAAHALVAFLEQYPQGVADATETEQLDAFEADILPAQRSALESGVLFTDLTAAQQVQVRGLCWSHALGTPRKGLAGFLETLEQVPTSYRLGITTQLGQDMLAIRQSETVTMTWAMMQPLDAPPEPVPDTATITRLRAALTPNSKTTTLGQVAQEAAYPLPDSWHSALLFVDNRRALSPERLLELASALIPFQGPPATSPAPTEALGEAALSLLPTCLVRAAQEAQGAKDLNEARERLLSVEGSQIEQQRAAMMQKLADVTRDAFGNKLCLPRAVRLPYIMRLIRTEWDQAGVLEPGLEWSQRSPYQEALVANFFLSEFLSLLQLLPGTLPPSLSQLETCRITLRESTWKGKPNRQFGVRSKGNQSWSMTAPSRSVA